MGCASRGVWRPASRLHRRWNTPGRIRSMSRAKKEGQLCRFARQRGRRNAGDRAGPDFGRKCRADCVRSDWLTRLHVKTTPKPSSLDGRAWCARLQAQVVVWWLDYARPLQSFCNREPAADSQSPPVENSA